MAERSDITSGLKQAIERGWNLQQAKQSFINSGYSARDVEDSARALESFSSMLSTTTFLETQQPTIQPITKPLISPISPPQTKPLPYSQPQMLPIPPQEIVREQPITNVPLPQEQGISKKLIITLVIITVILLGITFTTLFFKDKILALFGK